MPNESGSTEEGDAAEVVPADRAGRQGDRPQQAHPEVEADPAVEAPPAARLRLTTTSLQGRRRDQRPSTKDVVQVHHAVVVDVLGGDVELGHPVGDRLTSLFQRGCIPAVETVAVLAVHARQHQVIQVVPLVQEDHGFHRAAPVVFDDRQHRTSTATRHQSEQ
jgi:hypothetical protein